MCKTGLKAESMGMHKQNLSCFVILKQKHKIYKYVKTYIDK